MTGKTLISVSPVNERSLKACLQILSWASRALLLCQVMEKDLSLCTEEGDLGKLTTQPVGILCVMSTGPI